MLVSISPLETMAASLSQASPEASSLRQFQLTGVRDTGRTVGDGTYATVQELEFCGLKCVGKKLYQLLFDSINPKDKAAMLQRFAEECKLLRSLHHPCLVQYLGIYFKHGSQLPVLVTEYLYTSLSACLDKYGILPEAISYGILRDVALGLRYLHEHSPPIMHRDLSANNVLLTSSMSAKVSDLGVAKILNITPAQMTQRISTQAPGTPCYMPPEALVARPTYASKIDSFSYGVLMIHVLCGRWPFPADRFWHADPLNPEIVFAVLEIDRRAEYLQDISPNHPLMELIHKCLHNAPTQRPEFSEILSCVSSILSRVPPVCQDEIEKLRHWESRVQSQQSQIGSLTVQVQAKQSKVESLIAQTEAKQSEIESLTAQTMAKQSKVESLIAQTEEKQSEIESLTAQTVAKQSKIESLAAQLKAKHSEAEALKAQLSMRSPQSGDQSSHPYSPVDFQSQLHWRMVASLPVGMARPQVVVIGEKIYAGGGAADSHDDYYLVFRYNPARDKWTTLPCCPVHDFGLGQLLGDLFMVGGIIHGAITGKVYCYKPKSRKWEEFLQPMPTARYSLSVISTPSALIACGGICASDGKHVPCTTVEVFTEQTSKWCAADPLPIPYRMMSSATLNGTGYLLGGWTTNKQPTKLVVYASVASLIQKAIKCSQQSTSKQDSRSSSWKLLQSAPLLASAAASLGETLLAVSGGELGQQTSPALHVYSPTTSSWNRIESGNLPESRYGSTAVELPGNRLLVVGGENNDGLKARTVFVGSVY